MKRILVIGVLLVSFAVAPLQSACCSFFALVMVSTQWNRKESAMSKNGSKLLQQAQGIEVGPLFGDLAIHAVKEIAAGKYHMLTSWGKTLKDPLMRAMPGVANRYLVPLSDQVLSCELKIGKGSGVSDH